MKLSLKAILVTAACIATNYHSTLAHAEAKSLAQRVSLAGKIAAGQSDLDQTELDNMPKNSLAKLSSRSRGRNLNFNFNGTWKGALYPDGGTCGDEESLFVKHQVKQSGSYVELRVATATGAYKGKLDSATGFTVSGTYVPYDAPCRIGTAIRYLNARGNNASVLAAQVVKCNDGSSCESYYSGFVTR